MSAASGSRPAIVSSWVRARFQSPVTQASWNSAMRGGTAWGAALTRSMASATDRASVTASSSPTRPTVIVVVPASRRPKSEPPSSEMAFP